MSFWKGKHGPYLIAEIGGNHEGDFDYAKDLTAMACESGVDAVKFQIYTGESLVSKVESPDRYSHFLKFQLTPEQYIALAEVCKTFGTTFTASVWDIGAFEWIDPYMTFYKIGSGDLTAYLFLKKAVQTGKPIILSTGLAEIDEVKASVEYIRRLDNRYEHEDYLALLQCTSMYPIPDEESNLNVLDLFKEKFEVTVGYSDHTEGTLPVETAIAMNAEIIEMHFTDDRKDKLFRDHKVSFTPREIKRLIEKIDKIQRLKGKKFKSPTASEIEANHVQSFRRSVYAAEDLEPGNVLTEDNTVLLRPCSGIDARRYEEILGRKVTAYIKKYEKIEFDSLQ